MNKKSFLILKTAIFIFGIIVIALGSAALKSSFEGRGKELCFSAFSVSLVYIAAFSPLLCADINGSVAKIAASGVVYYRGAAVFGFITAADIYFVMTRRALGAAIGIEGAALFVFLIYLYFACLTAEHADKVGKTNEQTLSGVLELRKMAQSLNAEASVLGGSCMDIKKEFEKISENMRYLSPSASPEAAELERMMKVILSDIMGDSFIRDRGSGSPENIEANLINFDTLYRQRKNIR